MYISLSIYIYIYICMYINIHTYIYIYIHIREPGWARCTQSKMTAAPKTSPVGTEASLQMALPRFTFFTCSWPMKVRLKRDTVRRSAAALPPGSPGSAKRTTEGISGLNDYICGACSCICRYIIICLISMCVRNHLGKLHTEHALAHPKHCYSGQISLQHKNPCI